MDPRVFTKNISRFSLLTVLYSFYLQDKLQRSRYGVTKEVERRQIEVSKSKIR